jgi:glutathione S-transferase
VNEPDELLHIAMPDDWNAARAAGEYRISTRNRSLDDEGFIHCSYPGQLEAVANRWFADVAELVLLHIEPELLEAEVRVEPGSENGDELFPHIYGPIPTTAVIAMTWWDRDEDGMWHKPVTM